MVSYNIIEQVLVGTGIVGLITIVGYLVLRGVNDEKDKHR